MKISALNIGDELLNGKVTNTNAATIGRLVTKWGHSLVTALTVPDTMPRICKHLKSLVPAHDLLIITGGLGPTKDDLTRFAIAKYLGVACKPSRSAKTWLEHYLKGRKLQLTEAQKIQIMIPEGCKPLKNPKGTACGFFFKHKHTLVFAFPGVPGELEIMLRDYVKPVLLHKSHLLEKQIWVWGWPESQQRTALDPIDIPNPFRFSSLPSQAGVRICLTLPLQDAKKSILSQGRKQINSLWAQILKRIPKQVIIDSQGANLPEAVYKHLHRLSCTLASAESCTAGAVGFLITSVPGSSSVYRQGFVTYSNQAKSQLLGVNPKILKNHGAVSKPVVREMVRGCLQASGADFACAVSGIAGPSGGAPRKPVGTVWIAAGSRPCIEATKLQLKGDRDQIRWRSAYAVLHLLLTVLKKTEK